MKKKIYKVILFILLVFPIIVNADYDAYIDGSGVRMRSGAGTNYSIVASLGNNTSITVPDKTLYTGTGCSAKWYKVSYNSKNGYICSSYVKFVSTSTAGINILDWESRVNANNVAVRKGPSTSYGSQGSLSLGANVTILSSTTKKDSGCSGNEWYKIQYNKATTGYMCAKYITKKSDITLVDEEYSKILTEAGFPESYHPYLNYLHKKYPNWIFKAGNTQKYFITSVNKESGKCYMQTTNDNYRVSDDPAEGSSWFVANKGVIAFYMDPRNFLNEERIFMFEKLDYASELEKDYPTLVKSIFGDGKLGGDDYTIPMMNAGKSNKISPVHIASRIRLEVGVNGSDSTNGTSFTWKGKKYSGYYNFFNIGAYETTVSGVKYSAITRGLAYAAKLISRSGKVWDNIQTSITEGSSFLANGYVNKGQGTLYYQKFNVGANAYYSAYTHQYMTNIQAPATEGNQSYNSYKKSDVLDLSFIFEIPVYKSIPEYTSLPSGGNTNTNLKTLGVEGYSLSPNFDSDIVSYDVYVPTTTTKVKINATTSSSLSTVTGDGEVTIEDNESAFTLTVTSESGLTKNYTITINKSDGKEVVDETIKSIGTIDGSYLYNVKYETKSQAIIDKVKEYGVTSVVIKNASGTAITGDTLVGTNSTITITTTKETKTYTISVRGDTSGDGKVTILDLLQVQKHIKKASLLKGASLIAGDTSSDDSVTILDLLQIQKHIKGATKL